MSKFFEKNPYGFRIIRTAKDAKLINHAVKDGFFPLIKKVQPSEKIARKYAVLQNKNTGEIQELGDYRDSNYNHPDFEVVIEWTYYYPHNFPSPYAAYLVPPDIKIGEKIWIEDLIKDLVGGVWNQGDVYRLESAEAIWDGKDFQIQYDPNSDFLNFIG